MLAFCMVPRMISPKRVYLNPTKTPISIKAVMPMTKKV